MRVFTEKDLTGLAEALRVFVRAMSGERLSASGAGTLVAIATGEGLSVDALLNPANWMRSVEACDSQAPSAEEYIRMLCERAVEVRELKDDPSWHETESCWETIAEAAHDFYMKLTGKGGQWSTPSALTNLAKAVSAHSLQALLSEELIAAVNAGDEPRSFFDFVKTVAKDFNSLPVDDTPTEAQARRRQEDLDILEAIDATAFEGEPDPFCPEDMPYPDIPGEPYCPETAFLAPDPRNYKRNSILSLILDYNLREIGLLADVMEGSDEMSISRIVEKLAAGEFRVSRETAEAREVHMSLNGELLNAFISCVKTQGIDMDPEKAEKYDLLHDSWDLRDPDVRKLHKLKRLIHQYGDSDEDLLAAECDLQKIYAPQG